MATIILSILGITLIIVNANGWFIVPSIAIWGTFIAAGIFQIINTIYYISIKKAHNNITRKLYKK